MAGYCAQTNCFIEELTGREMLTMIAAMRGVSKEENRNLVDKWINIIGKHVKFAKFGIMLFEIFRHHFSVGLQV